MSYQSESHQRLTARSEDDSNQVGGRRQGQAEAQTNRSQADSALAERAARAGCTILITGETGVGKGHLASWIHRNSPRRDGPFIPVNCGAIPESLIDSQMFGHVRGAFSGASRDHLGFARAAEGGTLLLDEISELPLESQTRLLRLLQESEVQPVGSSRPIKVDVRVIAASNIDLRQAVDDKKFREDLLFRLDVVRLNVKPLRERISELAGLLESFNSSIAEHYGREPLEWTDDAVSALKMYDWPGNIRQLRTVVERLHVLCPQNRVDVIQLLEHAQIMLPAQSGNWAEVLERFRGAALEKALRDANGSMTQAAASIGVHRSTLYRWLKKTQRDNVSP